MRIGNGGIYYPIALMLGTVMYRSPLTAALSLVLQTCRCTAQLLAETGLRLSALRRERKESAQTRDLLTLTDSFYGSSISHTASEPHPVRSHVKETPKIQPCMLPCRHQALTGILACGRGGSGPLKTAGERLCRLDLYYGPAESIRERPARERGVLQSTNIEGTSAGCPVR